MGANNKLNKGICTNVQEEEVPTHGMKKKKITRSVLPVSAQFYFQNMALVITQFLS